MKMIHMSDLHIGKRVNEFSMIEDQKYIFLQITALIKEIKPDAVIIAGDVYDKPMPSAEAVSLFDDFLSELALLRLPVFIISGNHDSAERIAFASKIMRNENIYLSPVFDGTMSCVTLTDKYGPVNFYMLGFIKPPAVRQLFPDAQINTYDDAVRTVINSASIDTSVRNVLIAHQFVTGAKTCDSEEISVGGLDNVDVQAFEKFDYTALGHIHGSQNIGEKARYCGTPLKYSFSEANHQKTLTVAQLNEKGSLKISELPLKPLHEMREIRGSYSEITKRSSYAGSDQEDYMHITLTDETDIIDAAGRLRSIYPNIMKLDYDNARTRENRVISGQAECERRSPLSLFEEFYELQNNQGMTESQREFCTGLMSEIWEENV
ncbi:MAG: exonuclease SbcCD subunit D [Oscillospiraceae bacterium]|nr:exonuclease SbcCD subunit D [Oscillospiraceae bacterium]